MSTFEAVIAELARELKAARSDIMKADSERVAALAELRADIEKGSKTTGENAAKIDRIARDMAGHAARIDGCVGGIETLAKKVGRPAGFVGGLDTDIDKSARNLLALRHNWKHPGIDGSPTFEPTSAELEEARIAIGAIKQLFHVRDLGVLTDTQRKALSTFQLGSSGFIVPPEMSSEILSCVVDSSDVAGLMRNITISGSSVKFLIDVGKLDKAAWACETNCFANNPAGTPDLASLLGELEIKPESLRYIVCTTRDLLDDADFPIEQWITQKVTTAFRNTLSDAVMVGDGMGKPIGILNPQSGIPICETSAATVAGQFNWQDLVMLKYQVPGKYLKEGQYLMNQHTFALVLTLSDAMARPIMIASPVEGGQFMIAGSPVNIVTQMPDVAPGATPVAYGNWNMTYMIVNRKAVTMQQDPFTAGFCILYKFEARVGGGVICANAARLMRVR